MLNYDEIVSVGTANMDFRSFELNFEVNAFVYDCLAEDLRVAYQHYMTKSKQLTKESYANRPLVVKFKESLAKLVSPIL